MGAPIISLQNVSLTLKGNAGNVNIIKNISLDINKGESIGLIGPVSYTHLTLPTIVRG